MTCALKKPLDERFNTATEMAAQLKRATEMPAHWSTMDGASDIKLVDIPEAENQDLWTGLSARVAESLPDFALESVQRVQNKVLWRKYQVYKDGLAQQHGDDITDERELFHYANPDVVQKVINSRTVGFDPRLGGGEYGAGTYFAQHAIYSAAYGGGWLDGDAAKELAARPTITVVLAKVVLGHCKDFGARCRSSRGDAAATAAGVAPGLRADWGEPIGRGGAAGFHRPPPRPEAGPGLWLAGVSLPSRCPQCKPPQAQTFYSILYRLATATGCYPGC